MTPLKFSKKNSVVDVPMNFSLCHHHDFSGVNDIAETISAV
jgi:hypothetical protein